MRKFSNQAFESMTATLPISEPWIPKILKLGATLALFLSHICTSEPYELCPRAIKLVRETFLLVTMVCNHQHSGYYPKSGLLFKTRRFGDVKTSSFKQKTGQWIMYRIVMAIRKWPSWLKRNHIKNRKPVYMTSWLQMKSKVTRQHWECSANLFNTSIGEESSIADSLLHHIECIQTIILNTRRIYTGNKNFISVRILCCQELSEEETGAVLKLGRSPLPS
jgi:hypothetical protein